MREEAITIYIREMESSNLQDHHSIIGSRIHKPLFACTVCGEALKQCGRTYQCKNGHSFDMSKEGYVNLLMSGRLKRSRDRGYSDEMMKGRERFLAAGYYHHLADEIARLVVGYLPASGSPTVLDAGCGEGYYLRRLKVIMDGNSQARCLTRCGLDISKHAIRRAARNDPQGVYGVAQIYRMPILPSSVDLLLSHFSPISADDFRRTIRPGGIILIGSPGENHLLSLKRLIYHTPVKHSPNQQLATVQSLELIAKHRIRYSVQISGEGHVADLLLMTPYYWSADKETQKRLHLVKDLDTDIDVTLHAYRRIDD